MKSHINVKIMDEEAIKIPIGTTLLELSQQYKHKIKQTILLAKVNNQLQELKKTITEDCTIEFLDISSTHGFRAYQRSIVFLMVCAAKEVIGKKTRVVVEHSIDKSFYCEILEEGVEINKDLLEKITQKMMLLVERDVPIEKVSMSLEEAINISKKFGLKDKVQILKYRRTSSVSFYKMDWFYNYFYGQMVPSTGYLKVFKLKKEAKGFVIQFPNPEEPDTVRELKSLKKISKIFLESSQWGRILRVDTVAALNDEISKVGLNSIIRVAEALHEKKIANIADMIHQQNKNIVLIAGPSSSGKTTFAQRLGIQLKVNGMRPYVISLDNYYMEREFIPKDEFGELDFESIQALDVKAINKDLEKLLAGKLVDIPTFNFKLGKRIYKGDYFKMEDNDVLIIEGIHGLNDKIGENIHSENKFKIFISALTQLNIDDHNRIPTTDTRMIRRIVRDNKFRGVDALTNIAMWPSVLRGESLHIFPYQERADAMFNSALVYEMSILKQYAEPLLFKIDNSHPQHAEARRLIKFMDSFLGVTSESVPHNSILREFIGGSCFHT